jgi:hypothetical protein
MPPNVPNPPFPGGKGGKKKGGKKGKGKRGGKNRRKSPFNEQWMELAKASARAQTRPEQRELIAERGRAAKHSGVLDSAFDAYQQRLGAIQGAQQAGYQAAISGQQERAQQLAASQGEFAQGQIADADARSALLGQGGQVGEQIQRATAGGLAAQGAQVGTQQGAMAALGLADSSDLGRRSATGERDRIAALQGVEDYRRGVGEDMRELKRSQGDMALQQYMDLMQFGKTHRLARKGHTLAKQGQRHDQMMREKEFELARRELMSLIKDRAAGRRQDRWEGRVNRRESARDRRASARDGGGKGGSSGGSGGLSPSQKERQRELTNRLQSVTAAYRQGIRNGQSPTQAMKQARRKAGADRWMATVARMLVNKGKLNKQGRRIIKGHFPGAVIPKQYR